MPQAVRKIKHFILINGLPDCGTESPQAVREIKNFILINGLPDYETEFSQAVRTKPKGLLCQTIEQNFFRQSEK